MLAFIKRTDALSTNAQRSLRHFFDTLAFLDVHFDTRVSVTQGAAKGVRQKEFAHFFSFSGRFGHFSVTFSDASVTFFRHFFAKLLLPDSFCNTRVTVFK